MPSAVLASAQKRTVAQVVAVMSQHAQTLAGMIGLSACRPLAQDCNLALYTSNFTASGAVPANKVTSLLATECLESGNVVSLHP